MRGSEVGGTLSGDVVLLEYFLGRCDRFLPPQHHSLGVGEAENLGAEGAMSKIVQGLRVRRMSKIV